MKEDQCGWKGKNWEAMSVRVTQEKKRIGEGDGVKRLTTLRETEKKTWNQKIWETLHPGEGEIKSQKSARQRGVFRRLTGRGGRGCDSNTSCSITKRGGI